MRIFTERQFMEELRKEVEERERYLDERFRRTKDHIYRLEKEIELLKNLLTERNTEC